MKLPNKILYFLCFILTTSCQSAVQHVQLADKEMFSFAREVKATDDLKLISYGGGFLGCINSFTLSFSSKKIPNIDEARKIFVNISSRFLNRVNQNEALHCHLATHPFTIDNLDLTIIFLHDVVGYVDGISLGPIYTHEKREFLNYFSYDPSTQESEIFFKEPYDTSVCMVEQQENLSMVKIIENQPPRNHRESATLTISFGRQCNNQ